MSSVIASALVARALHVRISNSFCLVAHHDFPFSAASARLLLTRFIDLDLVDFDDDEMLVSTPLGAFTFDADFL